MSTPFARRSHARQSIPDALVAAIYEAVLVPDTWRDVIAGIKNLMQAPAGCFMTPYDFSLLPLWSTDDISDAAVDSYTRYFHSVEIYRPAIVAAKFPRVFLSDRHMADQEILDSEYYRDFLRHFGIMRFASVICGERDAGNGLPLFSLSLYRAPEQTPFSSEEERLLQQLHGHIERAARLSVQNFRARLVLESLDGVLTMNDMAICLLNSDGRLQFMNHAADAVFAARDGLQLVAGQIRCPPATQSQWQRALAEARPAPGRAAVAAALRVRRPSGRADHLLSLTPLPEKMTGTCGLLLQIIDGSTTLQRESACWQAWFGLTVAEQRLCTALLTGEDVGTCAEHLGIARSTARTQLKSVMQKTGCRRQAQLMAVLMRSTGKPETEVG